MVILATNFTATFSRIRYLGIKRILDKEKANYSHVSIVQASDLKEIPEEIELNRDKVTISEADDINMYPSIKLKKAIRLLQ